MRKTLAFVLAASCAAAVFCRSGLSQQANGPATEARPARHADQSNDRHSADSAAVTNFVSRMMAFDTNKDGKLTRDAITDPRLLRLFNRADANHDGVVTPEELIALAKSIEAEEGKAGGFGPGDGFGPGGPDGFGGPPGFGPGGPPPPGGFGFGPPQPGQVLPPMLRQRLHLTPDQNRQLDELQKEVDGKLAKILTDEQKQQLRRMRNRGPSERS